MKRTTFGIAALFLLSATPCVVNAFTAIAWSQSGQRDGWVKNSPTKEAAISAAVADCKKSGGGSDCKVFKVTDEPGFVALYATCAKTCGVTAVTGRATAEQARADGKRECEAYYRASCQLAQEWEEEGGAKNSGGLRSEYTNEAPQTSQQRSPSIVTTNADAEFQQAISIKKSGNSSEYKRLLELSASHGLAKSQAYLGIQYMNGSNEYQKNPEKAIFWLQKAADGGYADSFSLVAYHYYSGEGVSPDWNKASYWYERAANVGDQSTKSNIEENLSAIYSSGHASMPQSSILWDKVTRLAERGDLKMQVVLGYHYCEAKFQNSDIKKCTFWMEKAASKGDAAAQAKMGYANILGVEDIRGNRASLDYDKAIKWFGLSAKQGRAEAMTGLGWTYELMEDAAKKSMMSPEIISGYKNLSRDWHRKAAAKGAAVSKEKLCKRFGEWC